MVDENELEDVTGDIEFLGYSENLYTCKYKGKTYIYKHMENFNEKMMDRFTQLMKFDEQAFNIPSYIVSKENIPVGCLLEPLYNYKQLFDLQEYSRDQRIKLLKIAKNRIETMHNCGIIHFDLHPANIMFNDSNNDIKIIDFDNCSINNILPNDVYVATFIKEYIKNNGINSSVDTYMFNLDVIDIYYKIDFTCVLPFKDIVDKVITDSKPNKIWQKMKRFEKLTDDDYLIDYI